VSAMIGNPLLLPTEGYEISRSVRLRSSASAYLNRTPGSATNRQTWTWSGWCKVGTISVARALFSAGADGSNYTSIDWRADNRIQLYSNAAGSVVGSIVWDPMVFRDPTAWYHIVIVCDTTNATQTSRFRFYVNGVQFTTISGTGGENTWPVQNANTNINNTVAHSLGRKQHGANEYFDGYLTENNFIDGQALTPSSFGETDAITGVWKPKKYTGTYGTNGFYLNFSDNSAATAAAIGKDYSGNGNNWTPNNISVTAGVTYDSMLDVPTLYADGGNGRGNYCVLNAAIRPYPVADNIADGNLKFTSSSASVGGSVWGTIPMTTGKWYAECTVTTASASSSDFIGVSSDLNFAALGTYSAALRDYGYTYKANGNKCNNSATGTAYGASYTSGDVIGVALDAGAGTIEFFKNGASQGSAYTGMTYNGGFLFGSTAFNGGVHNWNFGQRPFAYTPPTGFKALNTQNLPEQTIKKGSQYMSQVLYTGTGAARSVSGFGMAPEFLWVKKRSAAENHALYDIVRGASKRLESNTTIAEDTESGGMSAFDADGFSISGANDRVNTNGATYVAWAWNAGGSTVTNTSGSISAQVRANATAGFSVVTYTGTGANATVGHGLGVAPSMYIVKARSIAGQNWGTYHKAIDPTSPQNYVVALNLTVAKTTSSTYWNNTAPTSTVFSVGTDTSANNNGSTYVAYCFAPVAGYSAFGSYTGNGSTDGPFVFTGFRPRWVMVKKTNSTGSWAILDSARDTYNQGFKSLYPDLSNAEVTIYDFRDFLSNGFKLRATDQNSNGNGNTYIYMAFAENPFKLSLAR
jgi:hypothetical protein